MESGVLQNPSPNNVQDEQKWTSYVKTFESYRITGIQTDIRTDRQTYALDIIYHAASRVIKNGYYNNEQVQRPDACFPQLITLITRVTAAPAAAAAVVVVVVVPVVVVRQHATGK